MDVRVYDFPTLRDGRIVVEETYCKLVSKYRGGEEMSPEEIDWMDSANNWLMTTGSKL